MVMEYVPGGTLKDRVRSGGALDPNTAAEWGSQVAQALGFAHNRGVIHRDIKSHNVLLTEAGAAKVTDFGNARAANATTTSRSGLILGTAGYMSPEQAKGEPVGPGSDLYSLGVVLYEMLTGELPYGAEDPLALAMKHVDEPPRSPREANPEVPEALDVLTVKLLAKNPEDRYASAAELADDLERLRPGLPPAAAPSEKTTENMSVPLLLPSPKGRQTRRTAVRPPVTLAPIRVPEPGRRRRRWLLPVLPIALFAGLLGALMLAQYRGEPESETPEDTSGAEETTSTPSSKVQVPKLYYASEAESVLAKAGLKLGQRSDIPNNTVSAGVVPEQNPAAGTEVEEGTAVDIVVSTGPAVTPPPVYDREAAKKAEEEAKKAADKQKEAEKKAAEEQKKAAKKAEEEAKKAAKGKK